MLAATTAEFARCVALISPSDAECLALAGVSGLPLATDDRKERRLFEHLYGGKLLSTLELIRDAAEVMQLSSDEVGALLVDVFRKGGFAPPRGERDLPLGEWYRGHLRAAGVV